MGAARRHLARLAAPSSAADKAERQTPSGLPVPRYVSLKFDVVNARSAPGDDSRLLWIYRAKGLPVQVVAETPEWRRICDPEGGLLVFEIKGGGIEFDPAADSWWSIASGGNKHQIKDPFRQARGAKYAILGKLREHRRWPQLRAGKVLLGHAVLFPDVDDVSPFELARSPRPVVCGHLGHAAFRAW